ncbi:Monothiol glutaredoxin-5 [Vanrija pseudolonga]|uniref:Monothiol glutaredoxin-5, mitochondrial n=1 Tax=Vanrija pseudolonga TaxID=143232 RepID=A0AAF1BHP0_9TREE|nr:Monothiol glutaredoxin-5 [Vanrija pseudolonga]
MFARAGLRTLRALPRPQVARASGMLAQRRLLSDEARKLIDGAVTENPLVVFMKGTPEQPQCGFSRAVVQILEVQGVPREKIVSFNCLADQELREGIKEYSEWPTIPQVYVKGEFVGGCDIMISMHQSGELEKLLVKEGLVEELPPLEEESK